MHFADVMSHDPESHPPESSIPHFTLEDSGRGPCAVGSVLCKVLGLGRALLAGRY